MKQFLFGVATAAYQIEGTQKAFKTIWDDHLDQIEDRSNCDIACDFYHQYEKDIEYIKNLNVDVYRMSISWARIQPKKDEFSSEGILFYKTIFELLKEKNIMVDVTLYHWDMPQWLLDLEIGFDHEEIISYFLTYAKKMFELYDSYVHAWATINEPWCVSVVGYFYGSHAPFVQDLERMVKAQYYTLRVHQEVYQYYKKYYKKPIGIVLNLWQQYPQTNNQLDMTATLYSDIFHNQIYLSPLFKGVYPEKWLLKLKTLHIDLSFMDMDKIYEMKNSLDYLGINYYSHHTIAYDINHPFNFKHVDTIYDKTAMGWEVHAEGLIDLIKVIRKAYSDIDIYITENGAAFDDEFKDGSIHDVQRQKYIIDHATRIYEERERLNIKGYYCWSLMDNFEWAFGYTKRFGLIYIDFKTLKRFPKDSYFAYKNLIESLQKG